MSVPPILVNKRCIECINTPAAPCTTAGGTAPRPPSPPSTIFWLDHSGSGGTLARLQSASSSENNSRSRCRARAAAVDFLIRDSKPIHTASPDTRRNCLVCVASASAVWTGFPTTSSRLSPTEYLKSEHVQSNRPIHTSTPDTTQTGPSCRK